MEADGSRRTQLTSECDYIEESPHWSPDGSQIVYTKIAINSASDMAPDLWVMNADGAEQRLLLEEAGPARWSPDGTKLLFVRDGRVFLVNSDGTGEEELAWRPPEWATGVSDAEWSPDGSRILVTAVGSTWFQGGAHDTQSRSEMFAVDLATGQAVNLADGAFRGDDLFNHSDHQPSWRR